MDKIKPRADWYGDPLYNEPPTIRSSKIYNKLDVHQDELRERLGVDCCYLVLLMTLSPGQVRRAMRLALPKPKLKAEKKGKVKNRGP